MKNRINIAVVRSITANNVIEAQVRFYLIALMIVLISIFSSCSTNNKPATQAQVPKTDSLIAAKDSMQSALNASRVQIDQLTTKTSDLDSQIRMKDGEIAKLQKERSQLARKNKTLAGKLKKDDKTLASLRKELNEKDKEYAEKLGILQSDKDNLNSQLTDLMKKYNNLKELGSVLHASDISLEPLHLKNHGKREKVTRRARKLNILRIHFDIDENRIAEDGNKKLYLVIDGPDGKLLKNGNSSGEMTTNKGNTIDYSILKEVYLKQNESIKDVTVDWKQEGEHEKGNYNIAIYNGGFKIGGGSVALK